MYLNKCTTAFVGLLCAISAVQSLHDELIASDNAPLKYLLAYKLSKDHLELCFLGSSFVFGSSHKPTVRQLHLLISPCS